MVASVGVVSCGWAELPVSKIMVQHSTKRDKVKAPPCETAGPQAKRNLTDFPFASQPGESAMPTVAPGLPVHMVYGASGTAALVQIYGPILWYTGAALSANNRREFLCRTLSL